MIRSNDLVFKKLVNGYYWYWSKFSNRYYQSEINNLRIVNNMISAGCLLGHSEKEYIDVLTIGNTEES